MHVYTLFSVFVGWALPRKLVQSELSQSGRVAPWIVTALCWCMRIVAPAAILIIFLYSLLPH